MTGEIVTSNGYRLTPLKVDPAVATGVLYAIVHRETGRAYIGITTRPVAQRWARHFNGLSRCAKLFAAIQKHGAGAFDRIVLASDLPAATLRQAEQDAVRRCEADGSHGFNLTSGGESNPMENAEVRAKLRAIQATSEYQEKHGAANKAAHNRPEVRLRKSAAAREALNRPDVKARLSISICQAHARPDVKARHSAGLRAGWAKRAEPYRRNWTHRDGRAFRGTPTEMVAAFPADVLGQASLSAVAQGKNAQHKGWRLAA